MSKMDAKERALLIKYIATFSLLFLFKIRSKEWMSSPILFGLFLALGIIILILFTKPSVLKQEENGVFTRNSFTFNFSISFSAFLLWFFGDTLIPLLIYKSSVLSPAQSRALLEQSLQQRHISWGYFIALVLVVAFIISNYVLEKKRLTNLLGNENK